VAASSKDIAMQLLDAMTAKDTARTLALFADGAVLIDPHYPNPTMTGKDAIGAGMDFAFGLLKQAEWKVLRTWETADTVVLEVDTNHELTNGMKMTPRQVFVADVKDGKVVRWQSFVPYPPPPPPA
jgi:ketosteroid isomerase-like protein